MGLNASIGGGYSSRSGLKDLTLNAGVSASNKSSEQKKAANAPVNFSGGANIPIGITNYVPVITNSSTMESIMGRIKVGGEIFGIYGFGKAHGMFSKLTYKSDASRAAYGYLYLQNASIKDEDILDFTRDKDGMFNKSMEYLPVPNMTYDIYSVSGQGTGGMFRPFRNDFGSVYDPVTTSTSGNLSVQAEGGVGNVFEGGADLSATQTEISSGPWQIYNRKGTKGFKKNINGSLFENVYFKQGGELTLVDQDYFNAIGGQNPIIPQVAAALPAIKPHSDNTRDPRGNVIHYHTNAEADAVGVAADELMLSHNDPGHNGPYSGAEIVNRVGSGPYQRKKGQIAEIVQVQKDGRKYVYGIAAVNNAQREATFSVDPNAGNAVDMGSGNVSFSTTDASINNAKGIDKYYSSSVTPAFTHSYLLTSVLSNDYVDVKGDGVTDDDLGSYTQFKYTRTDSDYRWVTPYSSNFDLAQYNPSFWSDKKDDKASFVCGSREQWYLHAIETKNYVAEFYISSREDAMGITGPVLNSTSAGSSLLSNNKFAGSYSYKLDSIKLYNKHDRFVNGTFATPIKTVFFEYDYSLCSGVPNSSTGNGKLTLQKIYFRYGNSNKGMISPYKFGYHPNNPSYNFAEKDRWGNYKPNNPAFTNWEFPYVDQSDVSTLNTNSCAWSLSEIYLPSGGAIVAGYESNDYAFVQNKPANEMFMVQGLGTSPNLMPASLLYNSKTSPCLYAYFHRRISSELPTLSLAQNYMGRDYVPNGENCVYFNFNVQLTNLATSFEQVKGYVNVTDVGLCPNNSDYGYLKLDPITPTGEYLSTSLNPITFTVLNTARYNLPQVVFPGQDPDISNFKNVLNGLRGAFNELINIGKNPVTRLVDKGGGKNVNLTKSFVRLHNVGMSKKGGGQRVSALLFADMWDVLAGGNEQVAFYGKEYSYKTYHPGYGEISSGVASYEPIIGGDENPFRMPVKYTTQSGSKWPPNNSVDLYQETPIGESLFPSAQVGYSEVTVTSFFKDVGRSSKTIDKYEFYTAKDFPVQVINTSINTNSTNQYHFISQKNILTATQGYTLILNDMHGKQKKIEHSVYNTASGKYNPVSYQVFNYKTKNGKLDNKVPCFTYNGSSMAVSNMQLGLEEDVTLDTREKKEYTTTNTLNGNLNFFIVPIIIPIPIAVPLSFSWERTSETRFQSAVTAKVIQQYGILDNIESYNEGAKTTVFNEIYDPFTGQPVVTSVNNEFKDKEYTTNIPAWWVYGGMAGAYSNIGYKDSGSISIDAHNIGTLNITNTTPLYPGDYLSVHFKDAAGTDQHTTAWVMGSLPLYSAEGEVSCNGMQVLPHLPTSTQGWVANTTLSNVKIKVISSGHKNQLEETVQAFTSTDYPASGGSTTFASLTNLITISAKTFCDSNTRILESYIQHPDSINPYAIGERGIWRLLSEYAYHTDRVYGTASSRTEGLFNAPGLFQVVSGEEPEPCLPVIFNFLKPYNSNPNWRPTRTITKWSPFGKEVENKDAIGNYSTAVFAYNNELPVAVASNARQGEILSVGFEDNNLLCFMDNIMDYSHFFPFEGNRHGLFSPYQVTGAWYDINATEGHTGSTSLYPDPSQSTSWEIPVQNEILDTGTNRYNSYYSHSPIGGHHFTPDNAYLDFAVRKNKSYFMSVWIKQDASGPLNVLDYNVTGTLEVKVVDLTGGVLTYSAVKKSNIIEGWQQFEILFPVPAYECTIQAMMPPNFYIDDIRIFPAGANMKAFVYSPIDKSIKIPNGKLMATLDENNFATMYEYDAEGNLVRVKKETAKGIMTVSESRQGYPKKNP